MRIFVFGNINAGKTYLISKLKDNQFSDYPVLSIDKYRMKYGDNSIEKEIFSQDKFVEDVYKTKDCFVECTGLGPLGKKLYDKKPYKNGIVIYVNTSSDICISRLKDKDFNTIPYPPVEECLVSTIRRIAKELDNSDLSNLWKNKVLQIFDIRTLESIEKIPLKVLSIFSNMVNFLYPLDEIKTIYPFGSIARNQLNLYSDIDCFISTEIEVSRLLYLLQTKFSELDMDIIRKKITIRDKSDLLIEIMVVKELAKGDRYIRGSLIKDLKYSFIKIDEIDNKYLASLKINPEEPIDSIEFLKSELDYFVKSLPKLIEQNNRYKYYFHNNIIIHNYIRISEILDGNVEYNYLPKVDYEKYKDIIEYGKNDLLEHYTYIFSKVNDLFRRLI